MTSNDSTAAQTLLFPIQQKEWENCVSDDDVITQYTLRYTKFVNMVQTGQITPTEEVKEEMRQGLKIVNGILLEYGFKPIYSDF